MKFILKIIVGTLIIVGSSHANDIKIFDFTEKELSILDVRKVRGADNNTVYTVGSNENGNFLKAVADNAASGLGKEVKIDLNKTPYINKGSLIKINFYLFTKSRSRIVCNSF